MMKRLIIFTLAIISVGCATVTDNVISSITDEQFAELGLISSLIEEYRITGDRSVLNSAVESLENKDLDEVYNKDYMAKILGFRSISYYYLGNTFKAKSALNELESITTDDELYFIASSLINGDRRLEILEEANEILFETNLLNNYLADAYLELEMYGKAAALFDTILLENISHTDYYTSQRDMAYNFMKDPPSSLESGKIYLKEVVTYRDLITLLELETKYLNHLNREDIVKDLRDRGYIFDLDSSIDRDLFRKDLAYFLFSLYAEKRHSLGLWETYAEFYIDNPSEDEKLELRDRTPVEDVMIYEYYFLPAIFLVEEEVMELPDGEFFYPENTVSGEELHQIVANLKDRLD